MQLLAMRGFFITSINTKWIHNRMVETSTRNTNCNLKQKFFVWYVYWSVYIFRFIVTQLQFISINPIPMLHISFGYVGLIVSCGRLWWYLEREVNLYGRDILSIHSTVALNKNFLYIVLVSWTGKSLPSLPPSPFPC